MKIEIEKACDYSYERHTTPKTKFIVFCDDEFDAGCETLAEAYLYAAKRFHELGMLELQNRINHLGDDASVS